MKTFEGLFLNWCDTSIGNSLEKIPNLVEKTPWVLITSIDSSSNVSSLKSMVEVVNDIPAQSLDGALLLGKENFIRLQEVFVKRKGFNLFNGFDEVWFFERKPLQKISADCSIVGPLDLRKKIPQGLKEWMERTDCMLGLGDGIGLNYVTKSVEVANTIENIFSKR